MPLPRIAIIGAGIAGLTAATVLSPHAEVLVVDKSRGVGGRMASRRAGEFCFDHGAQFFTARSKAFRDFLQRWIATGDVSVWTPRVLTLEAGAKPYRRDWFEPHYVGIPSMTALPKALAAALTLKLQWEVARVERSGVHWWLHATDGSSEGPFDWVIATAPAPQILQWFSPTFAGMHALQQVHYAPCFALMLGFTELPELRWDAARVKSSPLDWIVRGNHGSQQSHGHSLLLHSTHKWASEQLEADSGSITTTLLNALDAAVGQQLPTPQLSLLNRWRYAAATHTTESHCELDVANQLGACGDWSVFSDVDNGGARVESAFQSARALANKLLALPGFIA